MEFQECTRTIKLCTAVNLDRENIINGTYPHLCVYIYTHIYKLDEVYIVYLVPSTLGYDYLWVQILANLENSGFSGYQF